VRLGINPRALSVINNIAAFVESKNTPGSGKRFVLKFISEIESVAQENLQYTLCNNPVLARHKYSCRYMNNWVIVFRVESNVFIVYDIIPASIMSDI